MSNDGSFDDFTRAIDAAKRQYPELATARWDHWSVQEHPAGYDLLGIGQLPNGRWAAVRGWCTAAGWINDGHFSVTDVSTITAAREQFSATDLGQRLGCEMR